VIDFKWEEKNAAESPTAQHGFVTFGMKLREKSFLVKIFYKRDSSK